MNTPRANGRALGDILIRKICKMTKDQVIMQYIRGKITISEVRKLLNKIEGQRLVKLIDKNMK